VTLQGRTALVTGSTGGLGYAIAEGLARAGCNVVLHGIEPEESVRDGQVQLESRFGVGVVYVRADLSDPQATQSLIELAQSRFKSVDILVNNAVVRHFADVADFPVDAWDRALAVNLSAAFHTIRLTLPGMRQRRWGRVFNMTSVYGVRAVPNRIDYVTTKTALIGMTRAVALETINQGITCNAICPGAVLTPTSYGRISDLMEEGGIDRTEATQRFLAGKQPIQRFVDPAHIADLLVFLCGDAGRDITGAVLPVEGGWLAS
jgi:3-hydroxybutyrate dehydrogenase